MRDGSGAIERVARGVFVEGVVRWTEQGRRSGDPSANIGVRTARCAAAAVAAVCWGSWFERVGVPMGAGVVGGQAGGERASGRKGEQAGAPALTRVGPLDIKKEQSGTPRAYNPVMGPSRASCADRHFKLDPPEPAGPYPLSRLLIGRPPSNQAMGSIDRPIGWPESIDSR